MLISLVFYMSGMAAMSALEKLKAHSKKIHNFNHLSAICGWDQAAVMPSGGNQARSEAMAELSVHIHGLNTQPQLAEWLSLIHISEPTRPY